MDDVQHGGHDIINEYVCGMSATQASYFRGELSDVEQMYADGSITEDKFREMCAHLSAAYKTGQPMVESEDD